MTDIDIRAATPDDVHVWRALRMHGITHHPQAFVVTAEEAAAVPVEEDELRLSQGDRFLAFLDAAPVGRIGLNLHGVRTRPIAVKSVRSTSYAPPEVRALPMGC